MHCKYTKEAAKQCPFVKRRQTQTLSDEMTETQAVIATEIVSKENDAEITTSQDKQKGGYDFNTLIEKYDRETVSKMLKEVIVYIILFPK